MGLISLSSGNGLLFGLELPDITNFVWALGPAGLALILIAVAERIIVPKRNLVASTLKSTLARNYQYCWFAAYVFLAIFVAAWTWLLMFGKPGGNVTFAWGEIIRIPASFSVTADRTGEVFIQENRDDSGYTRRIVWVSAGTHRTIYLTFVRKGSKDRGEADTTYFVNISLDEEQLERARNRQLVLQFLKEQNDKPNRIVDEATRKEYPLPIDTADARPRPPARRGFSLVAPAFAEETAPSIAAVREALTSPSQAVRRDAVTDLSQMLGSVEVRRWAVAALSDPESDPNLRLSILGALRTAVRDRRVSRADAYFSIPQRQPALDFVEPATWVRIVREGYDPQSALGSTSRNLLRTAYDRSARAAFREVRAAAQSENERACVAYFEIVTYYNWLVTLALELGTQPPGTDPSFRSFVVDKPFIDELYTLDAWTDETRRDATGPHYRVNALRELYGEGLAYAVLGLRQTIRFSPAAEADPEYSRDTLVKRALEAFAKFEAEAASIPGFAEHYLFPWHLEAARKFRASPTLAALKASDYVTQGAGREKSCHIAKQ
jgi:hypothetical protein